MHEDADIRLAAEAIVRQQFSLSDGAGSADLHTQVREVIAGWLDTDQRKLFSSLYRLDISEARVQAVFADSPVLSIPDRLADLIIDRQLAKVQARRQYEAEQARQLDSLP
jgi:hypothetical protein